MKRIQKLADQICEELGGAYCYAESYIDYKASGNSERAGIYRKMAQDELDHANAIHVIATQEIEKIRKVYPNPPADMQKEWEATHIALIEKTSQIKNILAM